MILRPLLLWSALLAGGCAAPPPPDAAPPPGPPAAEPRRERLPLLRGEIRDAAGAELLPARVHVQDERGGWRFARSAGGTSVEYRKRRGDRSVEEHVTLSAHPFEVELPAGAYTVTVERGTEYHPVRERIQVGDADVRRTFSLRRWVDMAARGWYSGDTHVHRPPEELPNLQLAEDLNVAFPLTCWVTTAHTPPRSGSPRAAEGLTRIDPTHVYYPLNTEYEIFGVDGKAHTLGAFFVLNHRTVLEKGVPPIGPVVAQARREGALFELDKHNWPWSMALVPLLENPLYELSNNHVWRTEFYFRDWGEKPADYMAVETADGGLTERGWIDFGMKNYYTLLNCGFRLPPTAGTASGVHPVPLGFGRVYVRVPGGFSYDGFVSGLAAGRSFVTTGPMLRTTVNGEDPGHVFHGAGDYRVQGVAESPRPLDRLEILVNGHVVRRLAPANRREPGPVFVSPVDETLSLNASAWVVVRAFEDRRFAHTGPVYVDIEGKPLRPSKEELDYLIRRVREQIDRSKDVLPAAAIDEYRRALAHYEGLR